MKLCTFRSTFRHMSAVAKLSIKGAPGRLAAGMLEILPQLLFIVASSFIVFAVFGNIRGIETPSSVLVQFCLILGAVDCLGDALMFNGISQYASSLKKNQTFRYQLLPGPDLCKILFLQWDMPMLILGSLFFASALIHAMFVFSASVWLTSIVLLLGVGTHIMLTSAFFIIQAYFDPSIPLQMGNPASRLYTKPLHLVVSAGPTLAATSIVYPAFFMTAFPSLVATLPTGQIEGLRDFLIPSLLWLVSLLLWSKVLSSIVRASCRKAT